MPCLQLSFCSCLRMCRFVSLLLALRRLTCMSFVWHLTVSGACRPRSRPLQWLAWTCTAALTPPLARCAVLHRLISSDEPGAVLSELWLALFG